MLCSNFDLSSKLYGVKLSSLQEKQSARIPVVYKGKPYMPMRWKRAKRFVKQGMAKICTTKDGFLYLKLKFKPSGEEKQEVSVGWDPGSKFDGITVMTRHCQNLNVELKHTENISKRMEKRRMYRRMRRSRLWHRPIRFDHRTKSKLPPTIQSKVNFRIFILNELCRIFPISRICVEDVSYNHYRKKDGKNFSLVELGKKQFYNTIKSYKLPLYLIKGYNTHKLRNKLFRKDPKIRDKSKESFFAHCVDSLVIAYACRNDKKDVSLKINKCVYYIEHNYLCRRELFKTKNKIGNKKYFIKYKKGGEVVPFKKLCKPRKLRVKVDSCRSNHGPWTYIHQTQVESFHQFQQRYGGTIVLGGPRWNRNDLGKSKRLVQGNHHHYLNRLVKIQIG